MSKAKKGKNHPLFGTSLSENTKKQISEAKGTAIEIIDKNSGISKTFSSGRQAANAIDCSQSTFLRYLKSGKIYKGIYQIKQK
jgi:group I intron endonuclease